MELKDFVDLIVKELTWRKKLGHEHKFSKKKVIGTMIEMWDDIKVLLSHQMKKAGRGSIINNGWSKFGEHYFGL